MTAAYLKLSVLAIIASLLALTVKKQTPELALALTICGCVVSAGLILTYLEPVLQLFRELGEKTGLEPNLSEPMFKAAGIGVVTQIAAAVCQDAEQSALAKLVELGGGILCLVVSLPLIKAVLTLIDGLL